MSVMKRREFITLLGGAAAAWPLAARAQQAGKVWRIGILGPSPNTPGMIAQHQAFLAELNALGFTQGKNFTIEYARVDDPRGTFVAAAQLMRSPPDLIWANGPEVALQAVVGASGFIPIVILAVNYDPIEVVMLQVFLIQAAISPEYLTSGSQGPGIPHESRSLLLDTVP